MKKLRKAEILFLTAVLLLLSACRMDTGFSSSSVPAEQAILTSEGRNYLTLLYAASDALNPYTATTEQNRQLCRLLYEPLIKLDNQFRLSKSLAAKVETKGNTCTITLKEKKFSDGSPLTADDVVYSFGLAKKSKTEYAYKLYEISSASVKNATTVVFKLTKKDPFAASLLDFPILKKGSEKQTNSDGVTRPPIGCGRYVTDDDLTKLIPNTVSFGNNMPVKEIRLIDAPDSESVSHYVEVGAADLYYSDIADGNILRMSGKKLDINLNHLVMIGINRNHKVLALDEVRQAISAGIDRAAICRESYYNNALAANGFYNPAWEEVESVQNIETTANQEITIANLEEIGYNNLDHDGVRENARGSKLVFTLLVNSENAMRVAAAKQIVTQLAACGIKIQVRAVKYKAFKSALKKGDFQLYLAEVALTPNMDLSELILPGGRAAFGVVKASKEKGKEQNTDSEETSLKTASDEESAETNDQSQKNVAKLIEEYYQGKNTVADIAAALQDEMPFVPVCYRTGVLFYHHDIEKVEIASVSDLYFSITSYSIHNG